MCVARPLGTADIARTPAVKVSVKQRGCDWMRSTDVWGESTPREWDDERESKRLKFGLHGIFIWYMRSEQTPRILAQVSGPSGISRQSRLRS